MIKRHFAGVRGVRRGAGAEGAGEVNEGYLKPCQAAVQLNVSEATVRDYARRKVVPAYKIGKHWRFLASDLICSTNVLNVPAPTGGFDSRSRALRSGSRVAQIARNLRKRLNNS